MAVGSYNTESIQNYVDIIDLEFKKPNDGFKKIGGFNHEFPATKIMYMPDYGGYSKDIIATTAEYLRLWELDPNTNSYTENTLRNVSSFIVCFTLDIGWLQLLCSYHFIRLELAAP